MEARKNLSTRSERITLLLDRFKKENLGVKAYQLATNTLELPTSFRRTLETITNGRTRLNLEILNWDKKSIEINKMVNRLVFAIIIASLIMASAIITVSVTSVGLSRFRRTYFHRGWLDGSVVVNIYYKIGHLITLYKIK